MTEVVGLWLAQSLDCYNLFDTIKKFEELYLDKIQGVFIMRRHANL